MLRVPHTDFTPHEWVTTCRLSNVDLSEQERRLWGHIRLCLVAIWKANTKILNSQGCCEARNKAGRRLGFSEGARNRVLLFLLHGCAHYGVRGGGPSPLACDLGVPSMAVFLHPVGSHCLALDSHSFRLSIALPSLGPPLCKLPWCRL